MSGNEESIFAEALGKQDPQERAAYMDRACAGNPRLRKNVESLLSAYDAGRFLESPAPALLATVDDPLTERPGTVIGAYKLLEQIGEGGFGVVFMAEQTQPVRRKVALKVLKPGMDTRQVVARFEAERQALAIMDHPNIAKVHDGGATASGRPYFVMELVKGVPITDFCDSNHFPPRQRLELFLAVCQAVQHAHQKGIIHRDLKPSNVLVTVHDTTPVVKVIDFGVAKALGQELTDKTLFTGFAQLIGTPLYMSPEQAGQSGLDSDTRSDIYSLGVLLYELLTGTTPFTKEQFKQAAYDEIRRIIREEQPPKPSTRLSSSDTLPAIAAARQTEPAKLTKLVRGELDWIVMKALEKDRNRRYETANGLARDIERYLHDEPVQACPPSAAYRFRKFVRRNKAAFLTSLAVVASLFLAVVVLGVSAMHIKAERDEKITALEQAERDRDEKVTALERAEKANDEARRRLYRSLVAQARAIRRSRGIGQRYDCLAKVAEAAAIARDLRLGADDFLEMRNEVIACLALSDVRVAKEWDGWPEGSTHVDFDEKLERYARVDRQGNVTVRRVADDVDVCRPFPSGIGDCWPLLSPDGRFLLVWAGSRCRVWELAGQERVILDEKRVNGAFSPDSRQVALAHPDGSISLYELPSGELLRRLDPGPVAGWLAYHPNGRQLALACQDRARVCDLETGKIIAEFRYPAEFHPKVAWHPDGKKLATVGGDGIIWLCDVSTRRPTVQLKAFNHGGMDFMFNRAGDLLATNGWEGTLRLWDPRTGQQLLQVRAEWHAILPRFGPDDGLLAAGVKDGKLRLWEVAGRRAYRTLVRDPVLGKGHYGCAAASPKGRLLAAAMDNGLGLWDCGTGAPLDVVPLARGVAYVVFQASGDLLTAGQGETLHWPVRPDPAAPELLRIGPPQRLPLPMANSRELACSADGRVVACCQPWGAVVWHRDRPRQLVRLTRHDDVHRVSVSADGRLVATGGHWGTGVKVWDAATGHFVKDLVPNESMVLVRFSPNGKWLATTARGACRLWAVDSWQEGPSPGPTNGIVAFSPDGKLLAVETGQNTVRLVDPDTGREYARLEDPNQDRASWIAFSPDGAQLIVTGENQSLHVWDLRAIRAELARRDLDWGLKAYPPADTGAGSKPLQVQIDLGELKAVDWDNQAWRLAASADPKLRDPRRAVELAKKAVELAPGEGLYTLGLAHYRAGDWKPPSRPWKRRNSFTTAATSSTGSSWP
jgi:serine/threonine protein kinase/WD40 repeat protein